MSLIACERLFARRNLRHAKGPWWDRQGLNAAFAYANTLVRILERRAGDRGIPGADVSIPVPPGIVPTINGLQTAIRVVRKRA